MLLYLKEREVQQRRIEQQHLLQVYRKAVVVDLPQVEAVALVQTEEAVHIPDKRKKGQNGRICVTIERGVAYPHSAVCCVLGLCLMKLHLLLLKLCLHFSILLPNDHQKIVSQHFCSSNLALFWSALRNV